MAGRSVELLMASKRKSEKLGTGTKIALGVGGAAAVGGLIYAVAKRRKEAADAEEMEQQQQAAAEQQGTGPMVVISKFKEFKIFKLNVNPVAAVMAIARTMKIGTTSYPTSPNIPGNPQPIFKRQDAHPDFEFSSSDYINAFSAKYGHNYPGVKGKWLASWLVWAAQVQGNARDYTPVSAPMPGDLDPIYYKGKKITMGGGTYFETIKRTAQAPAGWDAFYKRWHKDWRSMGAHGFQAVIKHKLPKNEYRWYLWPNTPSGIKQWMKMRSLPDIRPIVMGMLVSDPDKWTPRTYAGQAAVVPFLPFRELAEMSAAAREYVSHWGSWSGEEQGLSPADTPEGVVERFGLCVVGVVACLVGTYSSVAKAGMSASDLNSWLNESMFQDNQLHDFDFTSMGAMADSMIETLGQIIAEHSGADWVEELADWVGDIVEILIG